MFEHTYVVKLRKARVVKLFWKIFSLLGQLFVNKQNSILIKYTS